MHVIQRPSYCIFILSFCNILTSSLDLWVHGSDSPSRGKPWVAGLPYRLLTDSCAIPRVAPGACSPQGGVCFRAAKPTRSRACAPQQETPLQWKPRITAREGAALDRLDKRPCCNEDPVQPKINKMVEKNN